MFTIERHRRLAPPRRMTGQERRRLDPNRGVLKVLERSIDKIASRFIFPHLLGLWHPYSWLLPRRFSLSEISISPVGWPEGIPPLRILLLSDIHTGAFLKSSILQEIIESLAKP